MASSNTGEAVPKRGRPRGFEASTALEAAMLTFWRHGYRGTSIEQLVEATGASRASLYHLFGDKRSLFLRALELYSQRFDERVAEVMARVPEGRAAMAEILNASADRLASSDAPDGCLRCNSTLELTGLDPEIDAALDRINAAFTRILGRVVERSAAQGELSGESAAKLPLFFTVIVNGMVTLARSGASREDLARVLDEALTRFDRPRRMGV